MERLATLTENLNQLLSEDNRNSIAGRPQRSGEAWHRNRDTIGTEAGHQGANIYEWMKGVEPEPSRSQGLTPQQTTRMRATAAAYQALHARGVQVYEPRPVFSPSAYQPQQPPPQHPGHGGQDQRSRATESLVHGIISSYQ